MSDSSHCVNQFLIHAKAKGFDLQNVVTDGSIQRFDRDGKKNGWYIAFLNYSERLEQYFIWAKVGDWKTGEKIEFRTGFANENKEAKEEMRAIVEAQKLRAKEEKEKGYLEAEIQAEQIWREARDDLMHPYMQRKGFDRLFGARVTTDGKTLLTPMYMGGKLRGLQRIYEDGSKMYMSGQRFKGTYCTIGEPTKDRVYLCEGFSTGVSIHVATGKQVIVGYAASNLINVAAQFEGYPIVVCADDDKWNEENAGIKASREVSEKFGFPMVAPKFQDESSKPTDFNDLHILEGVSIVAEQVNLVSQHDAKFPSPEIKANRALKNFTVEYYDDEKGNKKSVTIGKKAPQIWHELKESCGGLIKRVGEQVFANGGGKIVYLTKADALFGWVASRGVHCEWGKSRDMVAKSEFLSYIGNVADAYDYAAAYPHYPAVAGFYYINKIEPKSTGALDELVGFFSPDTEKDRAMLKAAFMTPAWGNGFGNRPGFLIVAREDDEKQGKGTGKTTITDTISMLYKGHVDLSKKSDDETIRKALMSAQDMRIARMDNLKGGTFSSETVESIMTSPFLSAHQMYKGHALVPNVYTFFITFNDAELSSDFSQRFVTVRIRRPLYDPDWLGKLNSFVSNRRDEIMADIGAAIMLHSDVTKTATRFPAWEREILSKCLGGLEIATLHASIAVDRDSVDEMTNNREEFSEVCREKLAFLVGTDPEKSTYAVRQSWVINWIIEFMGRKMSRRSATKLLPRILPQGFSPESKMLDGIDYLIWSGSWHLGDAEFEPREATRVSYKNSSTTLVAWKFDRPLRRVSGQNSSASGQTANFSVAPTENENRATESSIGDDWHFGD